MIEKFDVKKAAEKISQAVINTFQDMAFIETVKIPKPGQDVKSENILGIDIIKPLSSKIIMIFSDSLKEKIIMNVLSSGNFMYQEEQKTDIALEMLNIIAGNFIMGYFDNKENYKMEPPHTLVRTHEGPVGNAENLDLYFNAEDEIVKVTFKTVRYIY